MFKFSTLVLFFALSSAVFSQDQDSLKVSSSISEELNQYRIVQDSLRTYFLAQKPNSILKSSILEELFLWDFITEKNGQLNFKLEFNLHSFDCGAPDCYSTDVVFSIASRDSLIFPDEISYSLLESGCVAEIKENGVFKLKESSEKLVKYYSNGSKTCLVFQKEKSGRNQVYLFRRVEKDFSESKKVNDFLNGKEGDEPKIEAPFRISCLNRDYESLESK